MLVKKEIIRPGTYWYTDRLTGAARKLDVTARDVHHFLESGTRMLAAGLSIPVPVEHQFENPPHPLTPAERAAKQLLANGGWVQKYEKGTLTEKSPDGKDVVVNDVLFGHLDIPDPELVKKLPTTIKWTSPWINSFTDGDGRRWDGVISHVALTARPRITKQQPFTGVAAALSLGDRRHDSFAVHQRYEGDGFVLSRAGLLGADGSPASPLAFSLWSGAALAVEDLKKAEKKSERKDDERPKSPPKEGDGEGGGESSDEGGGEGKPGKVPVPDPKAALNGGQQLDENGMPVEEALVDPDGDISIYSVLQDLMGTVGVELGPDTTPDNFCERLYKALMERVKMNGAANGEKPGMGNQPPSGQKNDLPANPIVQEQPPLYMSLEEINKIPDQGLRSVHLSLHAERERGSRLEKNVLDAGRQARQKRIDRLLPLLPEATREKLKRQAEGAALSLGQDGVVVDPLAAGLDIIEEALKANGVGLTQQLATATEVPHPKESTGEITEERRKAVVEEMEKNAGMYQAAG